MRKLTPKTEKCGVAAIQFSWRQCLRAAILIYSKPVKDDLPCPYFCGETPEATKATISGLSYETNYVWYVFWCTNIFSSLLLITPSCFN